MSNAKEIYSEASKYYCEVTVRENPLDKSRYERTKAREAKYNENWKKHKVNIIDIVEKYAPGAVPYKKGYKIYWEGCENVVIADMIAGYLRIQHKSTGLFYSFDGSLTKDVKLTHFKIKRKEEM